MKNKLVAGFMAATMMVSVMSTGVFAKELDPDSETNKAGDTQVTATVEENENKAAYVIEIPDKVDFGKIRQPWDRRKCIFNQRYHSILYTSR